MKSKTSTQSCVIEFDGGIRDQRFTLDEKANPYSIASFIDDFNRFLTPKIIRIVKTEMTETEFKPTETLPYVPGEPKPEAA